MRIAAVIPLYNGEKFIETALRSVLAQTLMPAKIIVVDDGSTDGGAAVVRALAATNPITLLSKQNGGQSSARNFGIAHATSELIALLDQDDVWYPEHLAELVKPFLEMRARPLGWVYSNLDEIDEDGNMVVRKAITRELATNPKRDLMTCLGQDMFVLPSASLFSRDAFNQVGGFDEALSGYEDDDLFLRMFRAGFDNVYIDEALSQWRIYRSSSSYSPRMARSRRLYASKLIAQHPDDPVGHRYYTRDLLAPRFYHQMVDEYRKALKLVDNEQAVKTARENLDFIRGYMPRVRTWPVPASSVTISAIIPLYNGAPYIEIALRSVLNQTLMPAEIIVVDDGSTDDGPEIVQRMAAEYPIKLLRKPNGGQSSARNLGVAHSGGDLIALLDQDDRWFPTHLEELIKPFLQPNSEKLGWVYSNLDEIDEKGRAITLSFLSTIVTQHPKRDLVNCIGGDMFILPSASLISRAAFDAVGGFDERLSGYEDDDLFLRLFRAGYDNIYLNQALSQWRIYPGSSSYSPRMARSRSIYARKLLAEFPDDPGRARFYGRHVLAPRFFVHMLSEYRKALNSGQPGLIRETGEDLRYLAPHLSPRYRMGITMLLRLGSFGRSALRAQPYLRPIYRRLLS